MWRDGRGYLDISHALGCGEDCMVSTWWSQVTLAPIAPRKALGSVLNLLSEAASRSFYDTSPGIWQIPPQSSSCTPSSSRLHSPQAGAQSPTARVTDLVPMFELHTENPEKWTSHGREKNLRGGSPRLVGTEAWRREDCALWNHWAKSRKASGRVLLQSLKILLDCFRLGQVLFPVSPTGKWPFETESAAELINFY